MRDAALKIKEQIPKSDVNKEYFVQNMEAEVKLQIQCSKLTIFISHIKFLVS